MQLRKPPLVAFFLAAAWLSVRSLASHEHAAMHSVEASWEFSSGMDGWGNSTAEELDCELHSQGGELRGSVRGTSPRMDSPVVAIDATDRHYVVLRMAYHGRATQAAVQLRIAADDMSSDEQSQPWDDPDWSDTSRSFSVPLTIVGDGKWRVYYAALWKVYVGRVVQLRLHPAVSAGLGDSFSISWIKVAKAPTLLKVEGCINKYFPTPNLLKPAHNTTITTHLVHRHKYTAPVDEDRSINPSLYGKGRTPSSSHDYTFQQTVAYQTSPLPYATTYNCLREGGERVTLTGTNFGVFDPSWRANAPTVTVGGVPCTDVVHTIPQTQLQCNLPPGHGLNQEVVLTNGAFPGLSHTRKILSYAARPPKLAAPVVTNLCSGSVDLVWTPPADYWDAITVSGYRITTLAVAKPGQSSPARVRVPPLTLGNVTYASVRGLEADTEYTFQVAAITEDQDETGCVEPATSWRKSHATNTPDAHRRCRTGVDGTPSRKRTFDQWRHLDKYGRRPVLRGGLVGPASEPTVTVQTLAHDIGFTSFNANATLVHGPVYPNGTVGPTGAFAGHGHFGLHLVGDAYPEGCNASYACDDDFNETAASLPRGQRRSQRGTSTVCSSIGAVDRHPDYEQGRPLRNLTTNARQDGIFIGPATLLGHNITGRCGGALRLTASQARQAGAAWYPRRMEVADGFETTFTFRISNPSVTCKRMDDEHTRCRSRGSDGLAFVVQNQDGLALGDGGAGLGYAGIQNSFAVELDTYFNAPFMDPFENHIAAITRGWREPNSAHHAFELGSTTQVADLTDGEHVVKVRYDPVFNPELLLSSAFTASPHVASFLESAGAGLPDWTGMGTLTVWLDDLHTPVLIVPLNLDATLQLDR